ncbi:MAG: hypothetical protein ACI92G_001695 [Candidatus Pelagisphaera sp.]
MHRGSHNNYAAWRKLQPYKASIEMTLSVFAA